MSNVVFKNTQVLANHIQFMLDSDSPLRIQKSIYFLYALYAVTVEGEDLFPQRLFKESFEAWTYGPVLRTVYLDECDDLLEKKEWIPQNEMEDAIYNWIDHTLDSIDDLDDFQMVNRVHEDQAWKDAYIDDEETNEIGIMDSDAIIAEYKQSFLNEGE